MEFRMDEAVALLRNTPGALRALLADLPSAWTRGDEGEDTWTPHAVLGHLIHGERTDWLPRVRWILAHGASRPFEPFDRFVQLRDGTQQRPVEALLDDFAALRDENLRQLRLLGVAEAGLSAPGLHPDLGSVTLRQLLAAWAVHDLDHVTQISRVMAKQYAEAVGPWSAYLSVLRDRRPAAGPGAGG